MTLAHHAHHHTQVISPGAAKALAVLILVLIVLWLLQKAGLID